MGAPYISRINDRPAIALRYIQEKDNPLLLHPAGKLEVRVKVLPLEFTPEKVGNAAWKVKADGELDGFLYGHVLLPGKPVGVYGVGGAYSGLYYVDTVSHVFGQNGYRQSFKLLRNATGQNMEPESDD